MDTAKCSMVIHVFLLHLSKTRITGKYTFCYWFFFPDCVFFQKHSISFFKHGDACFCGNKLILPIKRSSNCTKPCEGNHLLMCGGGYTIDVYRRSDKWVGFLIIVLYGSTFSVYFFIILSLSTRLEEVCYSNRNIE